MMDEERVARGKYFEKIHDGVEADSHSPFTPLHSAEIRDRYERVKALGSGAFGEVSLLLDRFTGLHVAGKSVRLTGTDRGFARGGDQEQGLPAAVARELVALRLLSDHPNIVTLLDVYPNGSELMLVFPHMPTDLQIVIDSARRPLPPSHIKAYLRMLLEGLQHMHANNVVHRDIKPGNLLISYDGELAIADFGLARPVDETMSHQVATRWYRAPELLYGARKYGCGVDVWSAGVVFAEMLTLNPLFPGQSDIDQLFRVMQARGTPDKTSWPDVEELPDYSKICLPDMKPVPLDLLVPQVKGTGLDLLDRLLSLSPHSRPSCANSLSHEYFFEQPVPADVAAMRPGRSSHVQLRSNQSKRTSPLDQKELSDLLEISLSDLTGP